MTKRALDTVRRFLVQLKCRIRQILSYDWSDLTRARLVAKELVLAPLDNFFHSKNATIHA